MNQQFLVSHGWGTSSRNMMTLAAKSGVSCKLSLNLIPGDVVIINHPQMPQKGNEQSWKQITKMTCLVILLTLKCSLRAVNFLKLTKYNQVHMFFHYECFPIVVGDSFYRLHPLFSHNLSSQFWGLGGLLLGSQSCYQSKISTVLGSEDVLESYHGL